MGSTTPVKIDTTASILVIGSLLLSFAKTTLVELLFEVGFLVGTIAFEFTFFGVEFAEGCVVTTFLLKLCVIVSEWKNRGFVRVVSRENTSTHELKATRESMGHAKSLPMKCFVFV